MPFDPLAPPTPHADRAKPLKSLLKTRFASLTSRFRPRPAPDLDSLTRRILLPSLPISDEELARATHQDKGQKLARQERWEDLAELIEYADSARLRTPGGEAATGLLAYGARADLVCAAEDALHDGATPDPSGIEALEAVRAGLPDCYPVALVLAHAHVDIGLAWRTTAKDRRTSVHERRFLEHFRRAEDLLAPFDGPDLDAPSLAAAQCALLAARPTPRLRVADDYATLIDLDPDTPRHMRALGEALLPSRYGDYDSLDLEARRTAARTQDIWGAGGYAWVYLDALARDRGALVRLDAAFFIDGLRDIVARRDNQHVVNQLAAFCGLAMAPKPGAARLPAAQEAARARVQDCLDWLLEEHLHELHPLIWSQTLLRPGLTPALPSRHALIARGRQAALQVIAARFAEEIADGTSIAFSSAGMYRLTSL